MSIHSEIKRLRLQRSWSQQQLATEVSKAEGLKTPLSWQTVQQWEREPKEGQAAPSTAPKRRRLETVAKVLGTTVQALMSGTPAEEPSGDGARTAAEGMLLAYFRTLNPDDQKSVLLRVEEQAAQYKVNAQK